MTVNCYDEKVYIGYSLIRGCTGSSWGVLESGDTKGACCRLLLKDDGYEV